MTSFTVIYRTGGTERCVWKRCLASLTKEAAKQQAAYLERMGYKALVHETELLDVVGMPEGWEPGDVSYGAFYEEEDVGC